MTGKLLGASLLLAAAVWVVITALRRQRRQTVLLRELAAALDTMAAAIRWQRQPLTDTIAAMERYPLAGPYFRQIAECVRSEMPLQEAWHQTFSFLPVGGGLMTALELSGDEEKLTKGMLYVSEQLKECCRQRQQQQRHTAKLWLAGALSSAGLLIILLI